MNTEQHAAPRLRVTGARDADRRTSSPVCGCGQDLDVCAGGHCPRCGTSLLAHAA